MLTVDQHDLIRRKHLVDGMSQRAIAQELGHARNTVANDAWPRPGFVKRLQQHLEDVQASNERV